MTKQFPLWLAKAMFEFGGRKYSQKQLAKDLTVRQATVSHWLNGKENPENDNVRKLARHFRVTEKFIYELIERDPPADYNEMMDRFQTMFYQLSKPAQDKVLRETLKDVESEFKKSEKS